MSEVFDVLSAEISCCGVPHDSEQIYTMIDPSRLPVTTRLWETPLSQYITNQFSSIINTGKTHNYLYHKLLMA